MSENEEREEETTNADEMQIRRGWFHWKRNATCRSELHKKYKKRKRKEEHHKKEEKILNTKEKLKKKHNKKNETRIERI